MRELLPRMTFAWSVAEPEVVRRFTRSLFETAILTGVALRCLRALVLSAGVGESWALVVLVATVALVILFGVATLHLGNYPLDQWTWRTPAFAAIAVCAEMAMSAVLILVSREYVGSSIATWSDWPVMFRSAMLTRIPALCLYAVVLAGVVQGVRRMLARSDRPSS